MEPEMTTALTLGSLAFGWPIVKGADVELATDVSIHQLLS